MGPCVYEEDDGWTVPGASNGVPTWTYDGHIIPNGMPPMGHGVDERATSKRRQQRKAARKARKRSKN